MGKIISKTAEKLSTDVFLALTFSLSEYLKGRELALLQITGLWMYSAGSRFWNGECSPQNGRKATSKDPEGEVSAERKRLVTCQQQPAEVKTKYQKTHRRKDSWELHVKIEVRKSVAIVGLERTKGCKLPSKGLAIWIGKCTATDNSYIAVPLFCMLASNSLLNVFIGCNETKF